VKKDLAGKTLLLHAKFAGKLGTQVLTPIRTKDDLSLVYTPGVASVSSEIAKHPEKIYKYTIKSHTVAVVSDGSAVLGLGDIGAAAAIPVMEGKCALFKTFAGLDAFPICLTTQNPKEIISIVKNISPVFGAINLEDISAPRCFEIEEALQNIGIPVMHDDQHGTAVVVLAGLINALKVAGKKMNQIKVVLLGAGAAGNAIANFLSDKVKELVVVDSRGIISKKRSDLDKYKKRLLRFSNRKNVSGSLADALPGADVFIGVSRGGLFEPGFVKLMNEKSIIFALANPTPEIMPEIAHKAGAFIVASGRSDYPNQINNSLAFPGIFKGTLISGASRITREMKESAAVALSRLVKNPTREKIIPGPFDKGVVEVVSRAVINAS